MSSNTSGTKRTDSRLKREAMNITYQLPEDKDEALALIVYMRYLVEWMAEPVNDDDPPTSNVYQFTKKT